MVANTVALLVAKMVGVMAVEMVAAGADVHSVGRKFVRVVERDLPELLQPKCENSNDHLSIPKRKLTRSKRAVKTSKP